MVQYALPIVVVMVVGSISTTAQLLVIRQRLPDVESAAFYFGSRFSEIPNVLWSAIAVAFFPIISEAFEKGKDTRRILIQVLLFTVGGGAVVAVALGLGIGWLYEAVPKWNAYRPYAYLVVWMAMTNVFRVAAACFTTHEMACRRFGFISYCAPIALLEATALVSLTGYGFFVPYLPSSFVEWMGSLHAARLEFIVWMMLASSFATFLGLVIQLSSCRSGAKRASV
jgi:O-antigen/teichoic acid export membrane protein